MLHKTSESVPPRMARHPLRRHLGIDLAALALIVAFGATTAQAKSDHRYRSVIQTTTLSTANGYPGTGGSAVVGGTWKTRLFGNGDVVDHITITGHPDATRFIFKGTEIDRVARGTFKATLNGTAVVQSDGSQAIFVAGRFTGGTGAYRGASGSFMFAGFTDPRSGMLNGHSIGTISY